MTRCTDRLCPDRDCWQEAECPECGFLFVPDGDVCCPECGYPGRLEGVNRVGAQVTMQTELVPEVRKAATLSECGTYRYELLRWWDHRPLVTWVMLNPSTADADVDDPTIRRCMGFTRSWGDYGGIRVVNLFAYRATYPKALRAAADPLGPENTRHVIEAVERAPLVVVGWGAWYGTHAIDLPARVNVVGFAEKFGVPVRCLGTTASGAPRHPLYIKADQPLEPWPTPRQRRMVGRDMTDEKEAES